MLERMVAVSVDVQRSRLSISLVGLPGTGGMALFYRHVAVVHRVVVIFTHINYRAVIISLNVAYDGDSGDNSCCHPGNYEH